MVLVFKVTSKLVPSHTISTDDKEWFQPT